MDRPTRIITVDWGARVVGALSLIISAGVALYLYSEFNSPNDDTNLRKIVDSVFAEKMSNHDSVITENVQNEVAKKLKENEQTLSDFVAESKDSIKGIRGMWQEMRTVFEELDQKDRLLRDAEFATYLDDLDTRVAARMTIPDPQMNASADSSSKTQDATTKQNEQTASNTSDASNANEREADVDRPTNRVVRLRPLPNLVNLLHIENEKDVPLVIDQVSFDPMEVVEVGRIPTAPAEIPRKKVKHLVFDELKHNQATVANEHAEYRMSLKPFVISPQDEVFLRGEIRSDDFSGYGFVGKIVFSYRGEVVLSADDTTLIFVKR